MPKLTRPTPSILPAETHRSKPRHSLPAYQPALVGREEECQQIGVLFKSRRLITLVGPGGIGKTSLALRLATKSSSNFEHGVYFVSLLGVTSPLFLVSAIAEAIQFPFRDPGDFKAQLLDYLSELDILLVLDNYEHLLPDTHLISEILQSTQQVRLLVTSRHHLNLRQEWIFELRGLSYPEGVGTAQASSFSAVKLFVDRAKSVCPQFTLNQGNLAEVVSICRLVDGLPLAIELAAREASGHNTTEFSA